MIRDYLTYRKSRKRAEKLMEVDSASITRDFILDSRLLEAQQLSTLLGTTEVTAESVAASDERSSQVAHFRPLVAYFAASLSTGVMAYYDTVSPFQDELTDEEKLAMETWVARVAASCTLGTLAQLHALDLIEVKQ
jgi:hypothetical protein